MMELMVRGNENKEVMDVKRISNRISYLNTVEGKLIYKSVERVINKNVFSIVNRRSELYLYVGNNENPIDIVISSYNLQMQQGGLTAEVVIGNCYEQVKGVINLIEKEAKLGYNFSIEDLQVFLEAYELIRYDAIEELALASLK